MKKSNILNFCSLLVLVLFMGCGDSFLEEEPRGFLGKATLSTQAGVEAALIGAYSALSGHVDGGNRWTANPHNFMLGSITTDDAYKGTELLDFPELTQLEIYQWAPNNSLLNDKWVMSYEGVVRVNNALDLLAETELSDADRARIEGEARFLRAYYHFELYKVWGNVPYFTQEDEDYYKSNEGVNPLGDAIEDLKVAITLLPETQAQRGRADKYAARAMLGKMYLYGDSPDPTSAKEQLDIVVENKDLAPCLRDIFQKDTESHEEALFSVQASVGDGSNSGNANWLNQLAHPHAGSPFGCCGVHQPSQDLVNAYKVGPDGLPLFDTYDDTDLNPATDLVDPRIDFTIGRDDVPYYDWGVHAPGWIRDRDFGGPYSPKKFIHYSTDPVSSGGWNNNAHDAINYPVIRLADAILLLAEAEVMLGNLGEAEKLVNMIRERADNCAQGPIYQITNYGTPQADTLKDADENYVIVNQGAASIVDDIANPEIGWANYEVQEYPVGTFASQGADYAMNAVRWERRLELALEGHRLFDLRRWGIAAEVLNAFTAKAAQSRTYYENAETYTEKHRWYPIPTTQILANTKGGEQLIKQNPGY